MDTDTLVARVQQGLKLAFSNAITGMFSASLWIVMAGMLITLFIPVIPLRDHTAKTDSRAATGAENQPEKSDVGVV